MSSSVSSAAASSATVKVKKNLKKFLPEETLQDYAEDAIIETSLIFNEYLQAKFTQHLLKSGSDAHKTKINDQMLRRCIQLDSIEKELYNVQTKIEQQNTCKELKDKTEMLHKILIEIDQMFNQAKIEENLERFHNSANTEFSKLILDETSSLNREEAVKLLNKLENLKEIPQIRENEEFFTKLSNIANQIQNSNDINQETSVKLCELKNLYNYVVLKFLEVVSEKFAENY